VSKVVFATMLAMMLAGAAEAAGRQYCGTAAELMQASARARVVEASSQAVRRARPRVRVTPRQPAAWPYPRPGTYSYPGPYGVRHCVDWYTTEHRPSGTVITPQMRCTWTRG
jgi:hypothetical protein